MRHLRHDVAVLKLATRVSLNSKIQTVCLPKHGSRVSLGTQCYVTGNLMRKLSLWWVVQIGKACFYLASAQKTKF